ncbi:MAG: nucleotide pyrophosphohydrolase [Saprospiraceae bacterium]
MTIQEAQNKINDWIMKEGGGYFSELTNLGILTEETGELARWMVRKYGDQTLKDSEKGIDIDDEISDEIADVLWVIICLANQMKINLSAALEKNMEKKTSRDKDRHIKK